MPKIALVGEAPGEQEVLEGKPFVGTSGQELTRILTEGGISREDCFITNVFTTRPPGNDITNFCGKKAEVGGKSYSHPALSIGNYIKPEHLPALDRLTSELAACAPNIVLALGNTAAWALTGKTGINKIRGAITESDLVPGLKVLPTFHPAAILRAWDMRPITVIDCGKALRESEFPEIRRLHRQVDVVETLSDLQNINFNPNKVECLSVDIETKPGIITCIGFAPSPEYCIVIPFYDNRRENGAYWQRPSDEITAWKVVQRLLNSPIPKVFQNGMYDVQWLWEYGLPVNNFIHDTMICHHALQPELPKSLGFLASVYCNEANWKAMRPRGQKSTKDDE